MIISHKHKFIFIHCRKAAGSSVVSSLSRFLGDSDLQFSAIIDGVRMGIYPPRRVLWEALQTMSLGDYLSVIVRKRSLWRTVSNSIKRRYSDTLGCSPTHAPATMVATAFPDEWRDYFKFCVVRNPWDKTLSDYFWRTKRLQNPPSFGAFVEALEQNSGLGGIVPRNHHNWDMYAIDDQVAVDFVIRFEDLANDLSRALAHTSVEWDGWMPHMKKGAGVKRRNYREHYSDSTAQIIGRVYAKEINEFNYKF